MLRSKCSFVPFTLHKLMHPQVNKLSGHFPWFEVDDFAPCDEALMLQYHGRLAFDLLLQAPLPNCSLLDACKSNIYMLGIVRANILWQARQANIKIDTCEAVLYPSLSIAAFPSFPGVLVSHHVCGNFERPLTPPCVVLRRCRDFGTKSASSYELRVGHQ